MRYCNPFIMAILTLALLVPSAHAASSYSWEGSLEGWTENPDGQGGFASPTTSAPAAAITDGLYALELTRTTGSPSWTSVAKGLFHNDMLANEKMELDIYLPPGQISASTSRLGINVNWGGGGNSFTKTIDFNGTDDVYHFEWDYANEPTFNTPAPWSVVTMFMQGDPTMFNQLYVDNFKLTNAFSNLPEYTVVGNQKVYLDEQFDGDLKVWRETGNLYSGPDTVAAGDASLIRGAATEPGWRTRFTHGGEATGRALIGNGEQQWYMDPWYEGESGSPLGVNPFSLQSGKLHITADEITPAVLSGLPAQDGSHTVAGNINHTSGILTTENLATVKYGHIEMRAQMPEGSDIQSSFWLLSTTSGWPPGVVIAGADGDRPEEIRVQAATTAGDGASFPGFNTWVDTDVAMPGTPVDITTGFHDYALDWSAEEMIWYFDGVEIQRMDTPPSMQQEMYLLVNAAVGADATSGDSFPKDMIIDYITITQLLADYDRDGDVDQADYALWSSSFGQTVTPGEGADGNHDGVVDAADYTVWRDGLALSPFSLSSSESIPEPSTGVCLLLSLVGLSSVSRHRLRKEG